MWYRVHSAGNNQTAHGIKCNKVTNIFLDGTVPHGDCNAFGKCDSSLGLECQHDENRPGGTHTCQCKYGREDFYERCVTNLTDGKLREQIACNCSIPDGL